MSVQNSCMYSLLSAESYPVCAGPYSLGNSSCCMVEAMIVSGCGAAATKPGHAEISDCGRDKDTVGAAFNPGV